MLHLASRTGPGWADRALEGLDELLLDHAHCEKKAAGAALKLLFAYPERRVLQEPLARLAREELVHFEQVLAELDRRGIAFGRQRPSPYGGRLHAHCRHREPDRLVDRLLIAGLIEARSCERLGLLAESLAGPEPALAALYRGLLAAEARHHAAYLELALAVAPADEVRERCSQLARVEADALQPSSSPLVRLHN